MTREAATTILYNQWQGFLEDNIDYAGISDAYKMAIKALEQETVLDKIRAEIDQKQYDFMANKDYDEGIRFGLMLAYQIIDKYKAESEVENE